MSARRIAFLDVDGTILDHGRSIAPSTIDAVRTARAAGHLVYLSTGRSAADIHPAVTEIGFDGAITNGGAHATSGTDLVVAEAMPRDAVDQLLAWADSHGIHLFLQSDDGIYASERVRAVMSEHVRRWVGTSEVTQAAPRFRDIADADLSRVAKGVFLSDATDTVERAQQELGERFHVVPGSMPLPGGSNGEIGMRGTNKGSAIVAVLAHLGMDPASSIGIGDSWNDVEMFDVCGVGIAMGNADDELKALADEVTTSVREDGIARAFARHGLI